MYLGILADVLGRNKRKHADRGAESRKKNVLCHLAASSKGNIDTDMKNFLEDLVQASFTTFGEKFCQQFSDRLGKIETEVTQLMTASERTEQFETVVTDRLEKIEAEVTQLRTTLVVTELVGKSDQASGPSMTKINSGPSTSKKRHCSIKEKELKTADSCVNLPRAKVTQSSASDLRMGTQEFLERLCVENGEKGAPKKTKEAAPAATQTRDTTAASTSAQPESGEPREAAPWPRDPLTPFSKLPTIHNRLISSKKELRELASYTNRDYYAGWSDYHCILYNGLQRMRLKPTKFICDYTTKELGILRDVKKMWKNMGLGTLGYNPQPLYPDLVIQFLSSVELHYKSEVNKVPSEGKLTFLCRGLLYEMSIHELCILFGFETRHEACSLPKFPCAYLLWRKIADSSYVSREAKLAMLRNPVLRVVEKYMGHLLLGKSEAGSLTEDEAQLIHYRLPLALRPTYDVADEPPAKLSVNMGALFAQMLFERKFRGLRPLDRKPLEESIGSLLTRIFMHHGIDLSDTPCVDMIDRFDAQFFLKTKILHSGKIYRFTMPDGKILHCKLPQPAITSLTSVENMEFMPPAEVLYTPLPPASKRRCGSSSSGPAQTQCEDDTIPNISVDHTPNPSMEYLLPPYTGQFDSGAPPLDGTQQQQFAWTADTLVKLSTMMQTVWGALAKIRCPPTPSCCRAPQTIEAAGMTRDDAENEPSDEATDAERGSRLHRSRQAPGQSRSCSPDDHQ
ncbi:hypothetical protein HID58_043655 [Brassica napus]|uniref:Arabidopsis retrotransposon Orf1 C-terminal domain-containing protein n=1 Tax=Brassica napus TaxID=3708 RepID=A0ABQ8BH40_BRANA|nr:hypothetical protein HID58_043655 [Brassica napus]